MSRFKIGLAALGVALLCAPRAHAQGVAFEPIVGTFPSGAMMSTTPVVSADRRYVRLTINPQFTDLSSFATLSVPGAVSGGTGGALPGGLAGLNGAVPGAALPARSASDPPPGAGPTGGRSLSDPFQNALAQHSAAPSAEGTAVFAPRSAKATVSKRGARRREIIRNRP